ncbi:MAG: cysteine--tRNA ligase [Candidatus Aenigmarchaeota archaeon]|nr:cysteine--tRNA ligase [Candidatus Aenigmarchaeota archaeon]
MSLETQIKVRSENKFGEKVKPLVVFNTLTRKKEEFKPIEEGLVKIYVCGPTVYSLPHIGHARTYMAFDIIIRFLEYLGYKVRYVRNITDVGHLSGEALEGEDKLVKSAKIERKTPWEIADKYMMIFFKDMDLLGIRRPDYQPKASQMIPDMIEMIEVLLKKGFAYITETGIYFDVSKFEDYGKLSKIKKEELRKHRIEPDPTKRNPADFALWKFVKGKYPFKWKTPWGVGFPGWHLECSIMSMKFLGEQIDIHGGAKDLIFPHHENEIAQSEAYTGKKPFVKYWLHTGLLTINGEKMSKSKGNFITIREMLEKWKDPEIFRIFVVSSHYRSDVDYSEKAMKDAKVKLEKIYHALNLLETSERGRKKDEKDKEMLNEIERFKKGFIEAMKDDFNTPKALSVYLEFASFVNREFEKLRDFEVSKKVKEIFVELGKIFGLFQKKKRSISEKVVEEILKVREEFRKQKMFEVSDKIREALENAGIKVHDTEEGPRWELKI